MDTNSTKTYTSEEAFAKIFSGIFSKYQSFLKTQDSAVLIKYINYKDGNASYKINGINVEKKSVIFSRDKKNNSIYAVLELLRKDEDNIHVFRPLKIQMVVKPRKEERKILDPEENNGHQIHIINIMSEFILKSSLEIYRNKINDIEDTVESGLRKNFKYARLYMLHHGNDIRMNYFRHNIKPIIIKNRKNEADNRDREQYEYYTKEIVSNDLKLNQDSNYVSEITVPVLYDSKLPYGFIQVNGYEEFPETAIRLIKNTALTINSTLTKQKIFPVSDDTLSVYDISKNGIGISFSNKKCIKYFTENQLIYFTLILPDNKRVNILALVRHISIKGSIYKAGCTISEIDALSELVFDEYLESLGLST
ncbi:MAG: hypothetical protein JW864_00980 [Spirochaetes bacterium]|nr:hypothetical protein [Spirochaetota bacterium]